ncbi:MAG: hypothetical protein Q9195_007903 [Heterodermia aff. obscurata]
MAFRTTLVVTAVVLCLLLFCTQLTNPFPPQLRLTYILPGFKLGPNPPPPRRRGSPTYVLIVLGSGGHTAEMFSLLHSFDPRSYQHRSYVVSKGDGFSSLKAIEFERSLADSAARGVDGTGSYSMHVVPRAREIHQPLLTTPVSALRCLWACLLMLRTKPKVDVSATPDLVLVNGPGTAVIVVFASLILRFLALDRQGRGRVRRPTRTIYIESWARVRNLSLSGRILAGTGAVDRMLVQWEPLKGKAGAEWMGWMVK